MKNIGRKDTFFKKSDWGNKEDWVIGYWNSRFHPARQLLIEKIIQYSPTSILEVGSNCGPNLYLLSKKLPTVKMVGIDINEEAVRKGNELFLKEGIFNVELLVRKANELTEFQTKSFDVVFTCSTLIYIGPDKIKKVSLEMQRIAKKAIILLERHSEEKNDIGIYNKGYWLRDYKKLFSILTSQIKITKIPSKIWDGEWGKYGYIIEIIL